MSEINLEQVKAAHFDITQIAEAEATAGNDTTAGALFKAAEVFIGYVSQQADRIIQLEHLLTEAYGRLDGDERDADLCPRIKAALKAQGV